MVFSLSVVSVADSAETDGVVVPADTTDAERIVAPRIADEPRVVAPLRG